MTTPKENGFFMPAEWHPHTATWMAWPGLEAAYIEAPMGPEEAIKQAKVCYGEGTVLVTEHCQLNKNRNSNLSKADVEKYLNDYIGVSKVIWLNGDIPYDETGGHIDGLACFIRPGVVMVTTTQDKNHPDYEVLKANLETLKNSTDAKGRKLEIIEIDQPAEYIYTCPMNFYFANGAVIIAAYGFMEYDKYVLDLFKNNFTDREVIQLNTGVVLFGGGNIHCITQQQPAAWTFNS